MYSAGINFLKQETSAGLGFLTESLLKLDLHLTQAPDFMGDIFCSDIVSRQSTEMSLDGTSPEIGEKTALGD